MNDSASDAQAQMEQSQGGSENPVQAASRVRGERMSSLAHLFFAGVLLLASIVLIGVTRSYSISKNLDFVSIYDFSKAAPNRNDAADAVRAAVGAATSWVNDPADTLQCQDMVNYLWPQAQLVAEGSVVGPPAYAAAAALGATCNFAVYFKLGPMEEQLQIKNVTALATTGCTANSRYSLTVTAPAGQATISGTIPKIIISNDGSKTATLDNPNAIIGWSFQSLSDRWKACLKNRQDLANVMITASECQNGFSSPACSCVRAFTSRITSWQSRLMARPGGKQMSDVMAEGVQRCLELRRHHDVRKPISNQYSRCSALLVFLVALLVNGLYNVLRSYKLLENTLWNVVFFILYFAVIITTGIVGGKDGGTAEFQTVLVMTLPAFVVHATYLILLHANFRSQADVTPEPFLHPVTFDICLCALSLYTLVERGVVQLEYLSVDIIKCHCVAAVYIAVIWYYRYGKGHAVLDTEFVQQAHLVLFAVGLVLSGSGLVLPYAVRQPFEFHWILPLAFTYVAFLNPGWAVHLRMPNTLNAPASSVVYNFNAVAGFVFLLIGGVFFGYFLSDHIMIYGAKNFKYPIQADPQDYAFLRGFVSPVSRVTL